MVFQLIAALSSYSVQLMVGQIPEAATCNTKRVIELIIRIVHLIYTENSLQTTLIEWLVMSNEW